VEVGENKGKWCVIDRYYDIADGGHYSQKDDCLKSFIDRYSKPDAKCSHD
jgi:predicted PolB exonuclease-like 3'-5' exonuclease